MVDDNRHHEAVLLRLWFSIGALMLASCASVAGHSRLQLVTGAPRPVAGANAVTVAVTLTNLGRRITGRLVVACTYRNADDAVIGSGLVYFNRVAPRTSETITQQVVAAGVARGDCAVRGRGSR